MGAVLDMKRDRYTMRIQLECVSSQLIHGLMVYAVKFVTRYQIASGRWSEIDTAERQSRCR